VAFILVCLLLLVPIVLPKYLRRRRELQERKEAAQRKRDLEYETMMQGMADAHKAYEANFAVEQARIRGQMARELGERIILENRTNLDAIQKKLDLDREMMRKERESGKTS